MGRDGKGGRSGSERWEEEVKGGKGGIAAGERAHEPWVRQTTAHGTKPEFIFIFLHFQRHRLRRHAYADSRITLRHDGIYVDPAARLGRRRPGSSLASTLFCPRGGARAPTVRGIELHF